MNKLRIGVIVYSENEPTDGGGYSYFNTLLHGINEYNFSPQIEFVNIIFYHNQTPKINLKKPTIFIKSGFADQIKDAVKRNTRKKPNINYTKRNFVVAFLYKLSIRRRNKNVERLLKEQKIDFVYYLKQQDEILNYPFIATIWDVSHKSTNGFPEHNLNNNYEFREKYYLYTLNKAFLILCESETGANELKNYYSFYPEKIKVLPLFASNIIKHQVSPELEISTLKSLDLEKENFFIYPAQFWPHKNHYNLILAFDKLIKEIQNKDLKLVLCGSDKGNFRYIQELIQTLALTDRIIVPGFVNNDILLILYRNAVALTMPTFLGPTNIPLIEAAHLNCPVLCSDLTGHKEILGDCALYFNPSDSDAIKMTMKQVLDSSTRDKMIASAKLHITHSPFNLNFSLQALNKILLDVTPIRKTWGVDYFLNLFLFINFIFQSI